MESVGKFCHVTPHCFEDVSEELLKSLLLICKPYILTPIFFQKNLGVRNFPFSLRQYNYIIMCACMYVCMCVYVCMYVCMCVCMYVGRYVCMYVSARSCKHHAIKLTVSFHSFSQQSIQSIGKFIPHCSSNIDTCSIEDVQPIRTQEWRLRPHDCVLEQGMA